MTGLRGLIYKTSDELLLIAQAPPIVQLQTYGKNRSLFVYLSHYLILHSRYILIYLMSTARNVYGVYVL